MDQIENAIAVVADRIEEVMAKLEEVEQHKIQESEFGNELEMDVSIKSSKKIPIFIYDSYGVNNVQITLKEKVVLIQRLDEQTKGLISHMVPINDSAFGYLVRINSYK